MSEAVSSGRFRPSADRKSPRRVKTSSALKFYHEILGLDYLHYGLWEGEPFDMQGLKAAQERYTRTLFDWIPPGVKSVLDIGCGTGMMARQLRERGYEIEGLSPDPYQQKLFARRVERPFHLGRFQDFEPGRPYDLVLMSESAQYVWLQSLFPAVRRAVPEGHLLVSDYFVIEQDSSGLAKSGHPLSAFLEEAERAGLRLERQQDVTEQVLPSLDLARVWLDRYVDPSLNLLFEIAEQRHPRLLRIGRWLLRGQLKKRDKLDQLVDSAAFRRLKRYQILLFRVLPI